jgi:histidine triad (HIT) family protein
MKTFEDVLRGDVPVQRLAEDGAHLAFLAPAPLRPGHAIVVTKRVVPYLFDLAADEHAALWEFCRRLALRLRERLPCERVCVGVIGWQVRHVHVHLVPTDRDGEFPPLPGAPAAPEDLSRVAARLASAGHSG